MIKNIAIIGHPRTIGLVRNVIHTYYNHLHITEIPLIQSDHLEKVSAYLKSIETDIDGVLFTGKIPYNLLNNMMVSHTPWVYIEQNYSQLQRTLLEGLYHHQYDITNVSIDSYDEKTVTNAYREIQLFKGDLNLQISKHDIYTSNFLNDLTLFHLQNYKVGKSSLCITGISSIFESLKEENVPCLLLRPTVDTIKDTIERLKLKKRSKINEERQIVVLCIEPDLAGDYALINENEYQLRLQQNKIAEEITLFAQRIQAAVVETGNHGYLLFSTKNILDIETKSLKELSLLHQINRTTSTTVSVGIGFGTTAREAKHSAVLGMHRARKHGGHQAYVVEDNNFIGPLKEIVPQDESSTNSIESTLLHIADQTGISLNTIFRLHCIAAENSQNRFTSKELAELFGNSQRSMNRLLEKLELAGYIEITGKQIIGNSGRPSRVFKLLL